MYCTDKWNWMTDRPQSHNHTKHWFQIRAHGDFCIIEPSRRKIVMYASISSSPIFSFSDLIVAGSASLLESTLSAWAAPASAADISCKADCDNLEKMSWWRWHGGWAWPLMKLKQVSDLSQACRQVSTGPCLGSGPPELIYGRQLELTDILDMTVMTVIFMVMLMW